jgi:hypothetical protein
MSIFNNIKNMVKGKKPGSYRSMQDSGFSFINNSDGFISFSDPNGTIVTPAKKVDAREDRKPVDVWELLKDNTEPVVDTSDLDNKIKMVKTRIQVLSDHVSSYDLRTEHDVIGWLEARKKYEQHKDLFSYPTTNEESIQDLCKAYKLKVVPVAQYSGTMPAEAIEELAKFKAICKKIRKDTPVVRLIVPDNDPKVEKRKRDPILLVSSPFGNWDYILGAWDREVLVVDELVYMGK